jgi:hypothetical protein
MKFYSPFVARCLYPETGRNPINLRNNAFSCGLHLDSTSREEKENCEPAWYGPVFLVMIELKQINKAKVWKISSGSPELWFNEHLLSHAARITGLKSH